MLSVLLVFLVIMAVSAALFVGGLILHARHRG